MSNDEVLNLLGNAARCVIKKKWYYCINILYYGILSIFLKLCVNTKRFCFIKIILLFKFDLNLQPSLSIFTNAMSMKYLSSSNAAHFYHSFINRLLFIVQLLVCTQIKRIYFDFHRLSVKNAFFLVVHIIYFYNKFISL